MTWDLRGPVVSTYPLYYRPTYWWAGVRPRFNIHQQTAEFGESLAVYRDLVLSDTMPFFAGLIVLGCLGSYLGAVEGARSRAAKMAWWPIVWPLAACLLYAVVHTEPRYVSPFLALLFVAAYPVLACRVSLPAAAAVYATVLLTVMIPLTVHLANVCVDSARDLVHPAPPAYEPAAAGLRELGLKPGDGIAIAGQAFDMYYARYDRLHVIAQIPSQAQFWDLNAAQLKALSARLAGIGVKAIIAYGRPEEYAAADWKIVPGSDQDALDVLMLSPAQSVSH